MLWLYPFYRWESKLREEKSFIWGHTLSVCIGGWVGGTDLSPDRSLMSSRGLTFCDSIEGSRRRVKMLVIHLCVWITHRAFNLEKETDSSESWTEFSDPHHLREVKEMVKGLWLADLDWLTMTTTYRVLGIRHWSGRFVNVMSAHPSVWQHT